jgi:hypothetical protein
MSENETEDSAGIPGQIQYPEREVDAERAAAFAGGKVDSLEPEDEEADAESDEEADAEEDEEG